jgi:hypothetical protein
MYLHVIKHKEKQYPLSVMPIIFVTEIITPFKCNRTLFVSFLHKFDIDIDTFVNCSWVDTR